MNNIKTVQLANIDPDAVKVFPIGSLLANTLTADVYMIVEEDGKKVAKLIGSSGKYEIMKHLEYYHIISKYEPTAFNKASLWYNTDMLYVEPANATEAKIMVQAETTPGSGVYKWVPILPTTNARSVILGKDKNGNPLGLDTIIRKTKDAALVKPTVSYEEAQSGEIYINPDNTIWWKVDNTKTNDVLLADSNKYIINRLAKNIAIGENPPTHFDRESLWLKDGDDAGIVNSLTYTLYATNPDIITGLKFEPDKDAKVKEGSLISEGGKKVTIDLNNTNDWGHIVTSLALAPNNKYYMEIYVDDPEEKAELIFVKDNIPQATSDTYGTETDESTLRINKDEMRFKAQVTTKSFPLNKKTIFVMVDKSTSTASVKLGYVLDDSTLSYVYGNETTNGFTQNVSRISVGAKPSTTANAKVSFTIRGFKVSNIPNGYIGLNNILPNETAFNAVAPLTNAQSVQITSGQSLANLHAGAGRLITTPRNYADAAIAKAGELMLDKTNKTLFGKGDDGSVFPIGGQLDDQVIDHIRHSLIVTNSAANGLVKTDTDPSRMYISKDTFAANTADNSLIVRGNPVVIDNSPEGDNKTYKYVIPWSDTMSSWHSHKDLLTGAPKTQLLKPYLDELQALLLKLAKDDGLYIGIKELDLTDDQIKANFNTTSLYMTEILRNRMTPNSTWIDTVHSKTDGHTKAIDVIFNAPESGSILVHKSEDGKPAVKLISSTNGRIYTARLNSLNNILDWNESIMSNAGMVNIKYPTSISENLSLLKGLNVIGLSNLNGGIQGNNYNWQILVKDDNANDGNAMNVIKFIKDENNNPTIKIGDNAYKNVRIDSNEKPFWYHTVAGVNKKEYWLTMDDLANGWFYRGTLNPSTGIININNLKNVNEVGYWSLVTPKKSTVANGYPKDGVIGILEVKRENTTYLQKFTTYNTDKGVVVYDRKYDPDTNAWSEWRKTPSMEDLDLKYDKAGGHIFGDAIADRDFTVVGNSTLNTLTIKTSVRGSLDTGMLSDSLIMNLTNVGGTAPLINFGDTTNGVNFNTKKIPTWTKEGVPYNFALEKDITLLADDLHTNYYKKSEVNTLLNKKADTTYVDEELRKKLNKGGDTTTGDYTFTAGTFAFGTGETVDVSKATTFTLPGKTFTNTGEDKVSTIVNNIPESTGAYTYKVGNDVSQLLSFNLPETTETTGPKITYFKINSNGGISLAIKNRSGNDIEWNKIITKNDLVNNLTEGGVDKGLTAEQGKILGALDDTRNMGAIEQFLTSNAYTFNEFKALRPGSYYVNGDTNLTRLKLDKELVKNEGVLIVQQDIDSKVKSYAYMPITNKAQAENTIAFKSLLNTNDTDVKWVYVSDDSAFATAKWVQAKLAALKAEIYDKTISTDYAFTGSTTNTSMPYRLVHSHNNEKVGEENGILTFTTNIRALEASGLNNQNAIVNIQLRGFSPSSSSNIEVYLNCVFSADGTIDQSKSSIYYAKPGPFKCSIGTDDEKRVTFSVQDEYGNGGMSFDTYIRIMKTGNQNFIPEVKGYKFNDGILSPAKKVMILNENNSGIFTSI